MLATFNPKEEIFETKYMPPKRKKKNEYRTLCISQQFLKQLPDSQSKVKKSRMKIATIGKERERYLQAKEMKDKIEKYM